MSGNPEKTLVHDQDSRFHMQSNCHLASTTWMRSSRLLDSEFEYLLVIWKFNQRLRINQNIRIGHLTDLMSGKAGNTAGKRPPKFIYELPYTVTRELVELLNINDAWETLAGEHLQLKQTEISE